MGAKPIRALRVLIAAPARLWMKVRAPRLDTLLGNGLGHMVEGRAWDAQRRCCISSQLNVVAILLIGS